MSAESPRPYRPATDPFYQPDGPPGPETAPPDAIVSQDVLRSRREPPGQVRTRKWPVLHAGQVPQVQPENWSLTIDGLVVQTVTLNWTDYRSLPRVRVFADFHCVTRWSRLGNLWEGVGTAELAHLAVVDPAARYVIVGGSDDGWTTNLPLDEFLAEDALVADRHDGRPLTAEHGGPARLVVPRLYAWKSAKWIRSITFVRDDAPGYWERLGYHDAGDPWKEQRHR